MSSLSDNEKRYFENLFGMQSGYVLAYTDATFGELFSRYGIDIHDSRYYKYGTSKAKKLRAFWELEPNRIVAPVLSEILDTYETNCDLSARFKNSSVLQRCRIIVGKLGTSAEKVAKRDIDEFLEKEFTVPNLHKLPIEPQVVSIIDQRLAEARAALGAGAYLSVILLCGSVLEGVLLGAARKMPEKFNRSSSSPKSDDAKPKPFHEWSLAQLIDTASDIGLLKLDVKKFSHGLRDFRNYIHPYEQMASGFRPDEHTAKVCFQVLKAGLASIAGDRK